MNYNKIQVAFGALKKINGPSLEWQYNEQQILVIKGLDLPEFYEVDFCNKGDATTITMPATAEGVLIPDQYLQDGRPLIAYIVVVDGESVNTVGQITFPVNVRGRRTDISPEPAEQQQIDSLINALNSGVGRAEAAAEAIQDMDVEAETLAAGSAASVEKTVDPETGAVTLNFGIPKGDKGNPGNPGQDGMTPDFRIGTVETLNPGQSATATITGTPAQPVLNLGIPQGEKGEPGGGSGTSDYTQLSNKPQINGHTLTGNQSAADLGLGTYSKPASGIPKTDLASDVQASLGKADTALQTAPVQSVAGKTGAVTLGAGDIGYDGTETYQDGTAGAALSELNRQLSDVEENQIPELKNAISQLESEVVTDVTVTGTDVTIVAQANKRYLCGTVSTIAVTPCATGAFDLIFTSGSSAAILTIPSTVKWQDSSFDPTALDTNTIYEISVADGTLGLVAKWT